jgi:two-component system, LuxR family, sensor kinase FixL
MGNTSPERKVLIVVDEVIVGLDIKKRIQDLDFHSCVIVSSGEEALQTLESYTPDLILMDIMLEGGLDGVETANRIQMNHSIPIIFLTAYEDEEYIQRAKYQSPYGYLIKPVRDRELYITIEMALYKYQLDQEQKKEQQLFSTILCSIQDAVIAVDEKAQIIFMNTAAEKLSGWKLQEVLDKPVEHIFPIIDDVLKTDQGNLVLDAIKSGKDIILEGHSSIRTRTKELRLVDLRIHPLLESLDTIRAILVLHDVEETRRAREEKRAQMGFTQQLIDTIPNPIFYKDLNGIYLGCNKAMEGLLNKTREEIIGKRVEEVSNPESAAVAQKKDQQLLVDAKPITYESTIHPIGHPDQQSNVIINKALFTDPQGIVQGIAGVITDISELQMVKEKQEKLLVDLEKTNKELKEFAYIVSHDLKAPLRAILSLTQWLQMDYGKQLDTKGEEYLQLIMVRVNHLYDLIEGILQYSRVGRIREEVVEMDLNSTIPALIELLNIPDHISIQIKGKLPSLVGEKTRIEQIFQNLITNAVKFNDKPKGYIYISAKENGDQWQFQIEDNGIGIRETHYDAVFSLFRTFHKSEEGDEFENTGIGLTIVKRIVENYGGTIWLRSKLGKGSSFFFTLPKAIPVD